MQREKEDDRRNECKLLFHFDFKIIKPKKRKHLMTQDWDVNSNPVQRLILSRDTRLLMEVINGFVAEVYERVDVDELGHEENDQRTVDAG